MRSGWKRGLREPRATALGHTQKKAPGRRGAARRRACDARGSQRGGIVSTGESGARGAPEGENMTVDELATACLALSIEDQDRLNDLPLRRCQQRGPDVAR